jgi:DNA-binding transcriptional ArsR family regulator
MKMPHSTLSFYLKHLIDNNILAKEKIGYDTFYTVRDEDRIVRVLTAYKSSFLDKIVDRTLKTWIETHFSGETENVHKT